MSSRKWVNIGGRGFPPMGEPTGEPHIVFKWHDHPNQYVDVYPSGDMDPIILGTTVVLRAHEKTLLRIDLARALWDYVVANGWTLRGQGEEHQ